MTRGMINMFISHQSATGQLNIILISVLNYKCTRGSQVYDHLVLKKCNPI